MDLATDPAKLAESAHALEAAARAIETELRTLEQASQTLVTAWDGAAQRAYQAAFARYSAGSRAQLHTLHLAARSLGALADEYAATDEKGANALPVGLVT